MIKCKAQSSGAHAVVDSGESEQPFVPLPVQAVEELNLFEDEAPAGGMDLPDEADLIVALQTAVAHSLELSESEESEGDGDLDKLESDIESDLESEAEDVLEAYGRISLARQHDSLLYRNSITGKVHAGWQGHADLCLCSVHRVIMHDLVVREEIKDTDEICCTCFPHGKLEWTVSHM